MITYEYSDKELKMFETISPSSSKTCIYQNLWMYYRTLAYECFCLNIQGPAIESLRRCLNKFNEPGQLYRLTSE